MALNTHSFTVAGPTTITISDAGNVYPVRTTYEGIIATAESAGGNLYSEDKGNETIIHTLEWAGMSAADYAALLAFVRTNAVYSVNPVTWNDLDNADHTVYIVNNPFVDTLIADGVHVVRLELREEV